MKNCIACRKEMVEGSTGTICSHCVSAEKKDLTPEDITEVLAALQGSYREEIPMEEWKRGGPQWLHDLVEKELKR